MNFGEGQGCQWPIEKKAHCHIDLGLLHDAFIRQPVVELQEEQFQSYTERELVTTFSVISFGA
jgi:hypothetical protein